MALKRKDKNFRLTKITLLDFKVIQMDRVLINLFARLYHDGQDSRLSQASQNTVEDFEAHLLSNSDRFVGFDQFPNVVRGWLETHLLDLVNRGKATQAVAAPRPLHGYTYRFRNPKHCRDYGAAQHIFEMLWHARNEGGKRALQRLKSFFFEGIDPQTEREDSNILVDVETQALLSLNQQQVTQDAPLRGSREPVPPLCIGSADMLADDILRLMTYQKVIPRSIMVEYLKIVFAFHLALYDLRIMKLLPLLIKRKGVEPACQLQRCPVKPKSATAPQGDCPYRIGLFVDVLNKPETHISRLAEQSADTHFRRIPGFVKAYFATKKLDESGQNLLQSGKLSGGANRQLAIGEVLQLLGNNYTIQRDQFFGSRLMGLTEDLNEDGALQPEILAVLSQNLNDMDKYIEVLVELRGDYQRSYIVQALDSLMLKNRPGALLAQTRAHRAPRRFVLDSRLLEVLLQLAVLKFDPKSGYYTEEIKVEDLLVFMRERYGLFIDQLPIGEGFMEPSIDDRSALQHNKEAFKNRLREIGFFQDLSDAYITQHVTPRYRIQKRAEAQGVARV